jgi:hypothetical protein
MLVIAAWVVLALGIFWLVTSVFVLGPKCRPHRHKTAPTGELVLCVQFCPCLGVVQATATCSSLSQKRC